MRESSAIGVALIANRQSHFDGIMKSFENGLLFDNVDGLATILANLDNHEAKSAQKNARDNSKDIQKYLSWEECAKRFCQSLQLLT